MTEILTSRLHLIEPFDPILNQVADEVAPAEVGSQPIQRVIDRMLQLAAGKGHAKEDSRQMVGLAAVQLGVGKRIISIDIDADGSNKHQNLMVIVNPVITKRSADTVDRKSTRLNSSHLVISYAVFCLKKNRMLQAAKDDAGKWLVRLSPTGRGLLGLGDAPSAPPAYPQTLMVQPNLEIIAYRHGFTPA